MRKIVFPLVFLAFCASCSMVFPTSLSSEDMRETVHWMVDDAVMAASTQMMYELRRELSEYRPTETVSYSLPKLETAGPTSISQGIQSQTMMEVTPTPKDCIDKVKFVKDITIPDGEPVVKGKPFTKTWLLKNTGTCVWDENYSLVFDKGSQMGAPEVIRFLPGIHVEPEGTLEVSVYMTAPVEKGKYQGYWLLRDDQGNSFGTGEKNSDPIWVKVEVR